MFIGIFGVFCYYYMRIYYTPVAYEKIQRSNEGREYEFHWDCPLVFILCAAGMLPVMYSAHTLSLFS